MKILVTAGPTREAIDPVRFISNRSSGKMGYAIAEVARGRGHRVCLVSGPVSLAAPDGVNLVKVTTAGEMLDVVMRHLEWCDALIMAAAVADWRPATSSPQKLGKDRMSANLALERTPDILKCIRERKGERLYVGFAAETQNVIPSARRKLAEKGLDLIVANDVSQADAGFEVDTNRVTLVSADGQAQDLPLQTKKDVAGQILDWVERRARSRRRTDGEPSQR